MSATKTAPQTKAGIYNAADEPPKKNGTSIAATTKTPEVSDLIDSRIAGVIAELDEKSAQYALAVADPARGRLQRAVIMSKAIEILGSAISAEVLKYFLPLMNTPLGFKTDRPNHKDKSPYSELEVKQAIIVGLLNGVYPLFNEMNIIAGNCYITKEGYMRKVREIPGLTDLKLAPGVPTAHNGQTVIRFGATWKFNGQPQTLTDAEDKPGIVIAIPVNQYTGPDAIVGKATRKGLKRIFEQVTGSEQSGDDGDVDDFTPSATPATIAAPSATRTDSLAAKLGAQTPAAATAPSVEELDKIEANLADSIDQIATTEDGEKVGNQVEEQAAKIGDERTSRLWARLTQRLQTIGRA